MCKSRIHYSRRSFVSTSLFLAMLLTLTMANTQAFGQAAATNVPVIINYPTTNASVSGLVTITMTLTTSVWWTQLYVDGVDVGAGYNPLTWDSTTVTNGRHTLGVRAYLENGSTPIGSSSVAVVVANGSSTPTPGKTPTPTPTGTGTGTPTPTPSSTPTPSYFSTLGYNASLPSDQQCAASVPTTPETQSANSAFNATEPTSAQLAAYAAGNYTDTFQDDYTQYKRVDGRYTGSTDMIMRWAACKYGIDENIVRAQGWVESGWLQGGAGDEGTSQSQCVNGNFNSLWNTSITEPNGDVISVSNGCYQSWSAWQTKVYYEWMTWPMIMQSTAFGADYRYADQRACMNGAYTSYFASSNQQPNTYANDIANYKNVGDANSTSRVLWGCIGMHFSGSWYDSGANSYISDVQSAMSSQPWPK